MRARINRAAVASSQNYNSRRSAHRAALLENHNNNREYFEHIQKTVEVKPISDLQKFEMSLQAQIAAFRASKR